MLLKLSGLAASGLSTLCVREGCGWAYLAYCSNEYPWEDDDKTNKIVNNNHKNKVAATADDDNDDDDYKKIE